MYFFCSAFPLGFINKSPDFLSFACDIKVILLVYLSASNTLVLYICNLVNASVNPVIEVRLSHLADEKPETQKG